MRTFTIELPAGLKLLSLNEQLHWAERGRRTKELKTAAWAMAVQAKIPRLDRVSILVEYQPPPAVRRRDAENVCAPSGKPCIDGIVQAGVLADDESPRYVTDIDCIIGEPYPRGRLVIHLTEVESPGYPEAAEVAIAGLNAPRAARRPSQRGEGQ
jgi:crossover junction endodeoxyribonuclease RusA